MMDGTGAATWQAAYEAFGTRTAERGVNAERHRANTKDEDPTGLLNEGHRYRDLAAGVFISRDPAGFVDGPNVYTYVRQNPWSHYDPVGLFIAAIAEKLGERFGSNPVVEAMAPHTEVVVNTTQNTLAVASMVPALGKVADGLSAGISAADGNYAEAAATAGGGSAGKLLAKGVKALKQTGAAVVVVTGVVEETAKHGDEITTTAKSAREIVEQAAKQADEAAPAVKSVKVSKTKYPESYEHAQSTGNSSGPFTKSATDAKARRKQNLKGHERVKGKDLDEWPPAQTAEGTGASVKPISPSDNRGSGATIGGQTRSLKDGEKFEVDWTD